MLDVKSVELLARAYAYILSDAWGKKETADPVDLNQDTESAVGDATDEESPTANRF